MNITTQTALDEGSAADEAERINRTDGTFVQTLIGASWRHRWLVVFTVAIGIAAGGVWIVLSPIRYTSQLVIMPTEASQQLSDLLRNAGGSMIADSLSNLTGSDQVTYFDRFSKQLTAVSTAAALKTHPGLVESLMDLRWNDERRIWESTSIITSIERLLGLDTEADTSAQVVAEFLRESLSQDQDRDSPIVTLAIDAQEADVARQTLGYLYQYGDDQIKQGTYQQTQSKLEYLQRRLQSVTVNDYRQTMINLIIDQEKIMMLIQPNLPFAAQKLEDAEILSDPSWPKKDRILVFTALIGLAVGAGIAYRLDRRKRT